MEGVEERRAFVDVLEAALPQDANDAAREFVAWTKRYLQASEPMTKLFTALTTNQPAQYRRW